MSETSTLAMTLLTLRIGAAATLATLPAGLALGYLLARRSFPDSPTIAMWGRASVRRMTSLS